MVRDSRLRAQDSRLKARGSEPRKLAQVEVVGYIRITISLITYPPRLILVDFFLSSTFLSFPLFSLSPLSGLP